MVPPPGAGFVTMGGRTGSLPGNLPYRSVAMAGGLVILDWLFMAIPGLGLGIVLVVISVLTAMI